MNYIEHYNKLINKARNREIIGYTEKHHIVPRCMNGTDDKSNIVKLTPEEHYVAHQLLVKIYPDNYKLINAAIRMLHHPNGKRNNKLYGWLKKKYQNLAKERIGNKNGSYGKPWYHDPITKENGKFIPGHEPEGWIKGRVPLPMCSKCEKVVISSSHKFCYEHSNRNKLTNVFQNVKKLWYHNPYTGEYGKHIEGQEPIDWIKGRKITNICSKCKINFKIKFKKYCENCKPLKKSSPMKQEKQKISFSKEEKLNALRMHNGNIRHALFALGLNDSGFHYRVMKKLKELL